jgi:Tol biopolymer transport system component
MLTQRPAEIRLGRRLQLTLSPGLELDPSLSPDGKFVAYVAAPLSRTRLYVRQVEGGTPVATLPDSSGFARVPRWSPDGQRLVFSSERGIEVMPAFGGVPRVLVQRPRDAWLDAAWMPDGLSIVYALRDSVFTRPVNGGASRGVTRLAEAHSCSPSPEGRWIACASGNRQFVTNEDFGNIASSSLWLIPAAGGVPVRVTDEQSFNTSPVWLSLPVALLYVSNRDGGRDIYQLALRRSGRPAADPVRLTTGANAASVSASADSRRLVYAAYGRTSNVWVSPIPESGPARLTQAVPVTTGTQEIEAFDVSVDGRWLLFDSDRSGTQQLYRMPIQGGEVEQLTNQPEPSMAPSLSRDGREVAYHTFRNGTRQLFVIDVEGGTPVQVTHDSDQNRMAAWSPDGRSLAFQKRAFEPSQTTEIVSRDSEGKWGRPHTLLAGGDLPIWSPDGRRILTVMRQGDITALVIVPVSGGPPVKIILPREATPVPGLIWDWSPDGRFVYYISERQPSKRNGIWRVPVAGGAPELALWFDDGSLTLVRPWFRVRGNRIFFNRPDQQSDVWMTEILPSR